MHSTVFEIRLIDCLSKVPKDEQEAFFEQRYWNLLALINDESLGFFRRMKTLKTWIVHRNAYGRWHDASAIVEDWWKRCGWVGGVKYVLKTENYPNPPETDKFLWHGSEGSYTICNTKGESAHAKVTVTCLWVPKPGEGGGTGSGPGPESIKGEAVGSAKARDSDYWNEAYEFIKAVGEEIMVDAKRENDPNLVPSTWQITEGQASVAVIGSGGAAGVTGTAPSPGMGGTVVKSTCNECGKSDNEFLTFADVEFESGAVSVCKDGTASLTAIVRPQQASGSVDFDTEHAGVATVSGSAPALTVSGVDTGNTTVRGKVAGDICGQTGIEVVSRVSGYIQTKYIEPEEGEVVTGGTGIPVLHYGNYKILAQLCENAPDTTILITYELFVPNVFHYFFTDSETLSHANDKPKYVENDGLQWTCHYHQAEQAGEHTGTIRVTWEAHEGGAVLSHSDSNTFTIEIQ